MAERDVMTREEVEGIEHMDGDGLVTLSREDYARLCATALSLMDRATSGSAVTGETHPDTRRLDWLDRAGVVLAAPHFTPDTGGELYWRRDEDDHSLRAAIDAAMGTANAAMSPPAVPESGEPASTGRDAGGAE